MGTIRMTQYDTDLEERARQNAQNMFQNAIAPPGPPAATATPAKEQKPPVTINIGGEPRNPYANLLDPGFYASMGKNLGLAAQLPAAAINWANQNIIPPLTGGYKFGSEFNVAGVPGGTPGTVYQKMIENAYPYAAPNGCAGQRVPPADATPRMARVLRWGRERFSMRRQ